MKSNKPENPEIKVWGKKKSGEALRIAVSTY